MRACYYLFIFLFVFAACNEERADQKQNINKTQELKDSAFVTDAKKSEVNEKTVSSATNKINDFKLPPSDTTGHAAHADKMKNANVEIKIFKNTELSGFGYDIILDGHTYVHQPNIPAIPGNNGFSSERSARKVAELVSFKIRNNIMPPTIEVKELDSLGVR